MTPTMIYPKLSATGTPAIILTIGYGAQVAALDDALTLMRKHCPLTCDYVSADAHSAARIDHATRVSILARLRGEAAMLRDACIAQGQALHIAQAHADELLHAIPDALTCG